MNAERVLMAFFVALAVALVMTILLIPVGARASIRSPYATPMYAQTAVFLPVPKEASATVVAVQTVDDRQVQILVLKRKIALLQALLARLQDQKQ